MCVCVSVCVFVYYPVWMRVRVWMKLNYVCCGHFCAFFSSTICSCVFFVFFYIVSLQAGESNGLFKKTISKLSTEYRLQFVWPNVRRIRDQSGSGVQKSTATAKDQQQPKKSISLGAIRGQHAYQQHHHPQQQPQHDRSMLAAMPSVHKKRTTNQKEGATKTFPLVLSLFYHKKSFF